MNSRKTLDFCISFSLERGCRVSELSLVVIIEAGEVRSLVSPAFRFPLPDSLIWGAGCLEEIEKYAEDVARWPAIEQLEAAVVINRDRQIITYSGSSSTFDRPYQLVLFRQMIESVWVGYTVKPVPMARDSLAEATGREAPKVDSSIAGNLMNELSGGADDAQADYAEHEANDFRELSGSSISAVPDDAPHWDDDEDRQWWVSVKTTGESSFRHFQGSFVWKALQSSGPEILDKLGDFETTSVPDEELTFQGIVFDQPNKSVSYWSHPLLPGESHGFSELWSEWTVTYWIENGFRQQIRRTEESSFVFDTDLHILAEFVPVLVEQADFSEVVDSLKTSIRSVVRAGFGCLAMVLAVPAFIAWAVSGSWEGPFAFAAGLWLVAYITYWVVAHRVKRNFKDVYDRGTSESFANIAPDSRPEREALIDRGLVPAGLPCLEDIVAYSESMDDEDDYDTDDEPIRPIVGTDD